ncbi:unnamed protein product [Pleuronectes platessa]|uniref:Uncharacterized protein n=1 Tax=Pleuronectes platessa TaxID=8262 RepID=A0A9N7YVC8_PLEPL|nr:unnamed protein product [Pleuronectes platessa]
MCAIIAIIADPAISTTIIIIAAICPYAVGPISILTVTAIIKSTSIIRTIVLLQSQHFSSSSSSSLEAVEEDMFNSVRRLKAHIPNPTDCYREPIAYSLREPLACVTRADGSSALGRRMDRNTPLASGAGGGRTVKGEISQVAGVTTFTPHMVVDRRVFLQNMMSRVVQVCSQEGARLYGRATSRPIPAADRQQSLWKIPPMTSWRRLLSGEVISINQVTVAAVAVVVRAEITPVHFTMSHALLFFFNIILRLLHGTGFVLQQDQPTARVIKKKKGAWSPQRPYLTFMETVCRQDIFCWRQLSEDEQDEKEGGGGRAFFTRVLRTRRCRQISSRCVDVLTVMCKSSALKRGQFHKLISDKRKYLAGLSSSEGDTVVELSARREFSMAV